MVPTWRYVHMYGKWFIHSHVRAPFRGFSMHMSKFSNGMVVQKLSVAQGSSMAVCRALPARQACPGRALLGLLLLGLPLGRTLPQIWAEICRSVSCLHYKPDQWLARSKLRCFACMTFKTKLPFVRSKHHSTQSYSHNLTCIPM